MQKRKFGNTGEEVSILGLGCMRFPLKNQDDPASIDEEQAAQMIHHAIDNGVNYIDTAWPYHEGESEPFVGKVLADGYRDKVYLATKLPCWEISSRADMDRIFQQQLDKLQTDHIDFYLVHSLNHDHWNTVRKHGIFEFLEDIKRDGRAKHVGFSFHDELPLFKEIIDAYAWDFVQIQYNYLDTHFQAGEEGLAYASERGLGIVIMEPVRGGTLAGPFTEAVNTQIKESKRKYTPVEWALRWLWNDPRIHVVLSGASSIQQIMENTATAQDAKAGDFTDADHRTIENIRTSFLESYKVPCTSCGYCIPCPHGVLIPNCFRSYNTYLMFPDQRRQTIFQYNNFIPEGKRASDCVECGTCEEHCPQQIPIIQRLKDVASAFGS